ncbi:hypothetical protein ACSDR0_44640 [Streptosporangium sp. G11]|uniref:hypothetical protein n=1 Tax=Streptosporangium sp. G11 TaxID=3436926 RepID=UPI003EBA9A8B
MRDGAPQLFKESGFSGSGTHGAARAALISATDTLRVELAAQGTQILGVQMALTDTELVSQLLPPRERGITPCTSGVGL